MSHLQIPIKGPRKRASSEAVKENEQHRKKFIDAEVLEMRETNVDDWTTEIMGVIKAKRRGEIQARQNGMRVEKQSRKVRRAPCYARKENSGIKNDATCSRGHKRCSECLIINFRTSISHETWFNGSIMGTWDICPMLS